MRTLKKWVFWISGFSVLSIAVTAHAQKPQLYQPLNSAPLVKSRLKGLKVIRQGAFKTIPSTLKVKLVKGQTVQLKKLSETLFKSQFAQRKILKKLVGKKRGIRGKVRIESNWQETKDFIQLAASTSLTVDDPKKLRKEWKQYRSFLKNQKPVNLRKSKGKPIPKAVKKALKKYKKKLRKLPQNDPLRKAMAKGDAALLKAIIEGQGELRVVQTVVIPKKLIKLEKKRLHIPQFGAKGFEYAKKTRKQKVPWAMTKTKFKLPKTVPPFKLKNEGKKYGSKDNVFFDIDGKHKLNQHFLTGWTLEQGFEYHERWSFPSGHLEIRAGAVYAVGVRVPVKAEATISPTTFSTISTSNQLLKSQDITVKIRAKAFNGTPLDYTKAGLKEDGPWRGKEIPLYAGVYVSCSFRAL
ncbi:MAG: hypothetical protein CMH52_10590 [Myxococcales bacterium]|nr:hypothetical protein [Myxococcales bacterium]